MAAAAAVQHAAVAAAGARPARRRHGGALAVAARGRRAQRSGDEAAEAPLRGEFVQPQADELPQSLAAEKDSLADLLPDPANPPESLLDDSFFSSATFGSGSEWDWQSPGGGQYESADYGAAFGALDPAGGFGAAPPGGAGGADDAFFGGSDFFALQSDDWTEDFVSEVGEGSSFRRQERERYAAPGLRNMANLAHATEEELLAAAEVQALREGQIEEVMDESIELHHFFMTNSRNKYAVAQRLGDLMEEFEYDENPLGYMQEELHPAAGEALPLWCRAVFSLADEWGEFEEEVALAEEEQTEREVAFEQARVTELLQRAVSTWEVDGQSHQPLSPELLASFGLAPEAAGGSAAAPQTLESMLLGVLPATSDEASSDTPPGDTESEDYAMQLMQRADGKEEAQDFMSQPIEELAREVFSELGDIFDPAAFAEQEEEEEEEGQQQGGQRAGTIGEAAALSGSAATAAAAGDEDEEDSSFLLEDFISGLGDSDEEEGEEASGGAAAAEQQPEDKQRRTRSSSSSSSSKGSGKGGGEVPGLQYELDADLF